MLLTLRYCSFYALIMHQTLCNTNQKGVKGLQFAMQAHVLTTHLSKVHLSTQHTKQLPVFSTTLQGLMFAGG